MAASAALIDALKHALRGRSLTYAHVARHLAMSEASVKRMFSHKDLTLKRLDRICEFAHIDFSELARALHANETRLSQLSPEQEKEIIADRKLFLVAVCVLNHVTFEQIVGAYDISRAECTKLLLRLDHLKFVELLPNNRIKLLVSQAFSWLPDGPIQRFFNQQAHNEFFRSQFDRPGEFMLVVNGMLSKRSSVAMVERLKRMAKEFTDLHNEDASLPLGERTPMSLLVAIRHWELQAFAELRRRRK